MKSACIDGSRSASLKATEALAVGLRGPDGRPAERRVADGTAAQRRQLQSLCTRTLSQLIATALAQPAGHASAEQTDCGGGPFRLVCFVLTRRAVEPRQWPNRISIVHPHPTRASCSSGSAQCRCVVRCRRTARIDPVGAAAARSRETARPLRPFFSRSLPTNHSVRADVRDRSR